MEILENNVSFFFSHLEKKRESCKTKSCKKTRGSQVQRNITQLLESNSSRKSHQQHVINQNITSFEKMRHHATKYMVHEKILYNMGDGEIHNGSADGVDGDPIEI